MSEEKCRELVVAKVISELNQLIQPRNTSGMVEVFTTAIIVGIVDALGKEVPPPLRHHRRHALCEAAETLTAFISAWTALAPPLVIETAGQRYKQMAHFLYLSPILHENADLSLEIDRRIRLMRASVKRFGPEKYDRTTAALSPKVRMLKAEVTGTLPSGCVTWTLRAEHFARLRTARHRVLLRVIGFQSRLRTDHANLSNAKAFKMTRCESIETILRIRRLFFAGGVARQSKKGLPSRGDG